MFGKNPHLFAAQPNNLSNTKNKEATKNYLYLWTLEILLAFFQYCYIGGASVDTDVSVQYLREHITQLKQRWIKNVKYKTNITNDLSLS